ncbi:MAG: 1-(5-phosphoribosyl)-5-[(5-phosphoribosylamino)methylideneamino]imidazole-4-carboxamide isomerase [Alphaproteobacteria bacterium]|nr:1-(5-phosphoribosyl)-5-[(5-phosphoribosylamino)methylideneamino]imidazole-4-carboxamide isomerase [Alphaproteobacteria bacterium]MBP7758704.1 1-(5-phosphoribosyl)-5-[(5-phosphoribosylamino)methylideneamino]imidazole-4-carboxamide isomerase [Alphaproteobacteria bacterium]MBP7761732.1 1-(5-phosphoribosyl)-5-[(5-phosphoribosylamino)methylideneamino]imidazole-4-carboxamide isomerase [Alphaproteobacteria bacterium]MBP7903933.1 1-(5-phosphoribosyl)-5-[(5-phosphoribosylamino)methylideneamino]imidazo
MIIYPAIDLKGGKCVRLYKGDMKLDTVYSDDPSAQALEWARCGFSWIHIVDLDGAIQGKSMNAASVRAIVKSVDIPVQLGGGIRSLEQIRQWLEEGINRVILGTIAVEDPALVIEACRYYPGQIAVGIDARGGKVAIQGWVEDSEVKATELAKRFEDIGVSCIIYTDIERDGTGIGPNIDATIALARATSIPIIASGGVGSLQDLTRLRDAEHEGIDGVIIGKALYEKKFTPAEALKTVAPLQTEIIS